MSKQTTKPKPERKPIEQHITQALKEAQAFPLDMRIAAKLIDDGYHEDDFHQVKFPLIGQPIIIAVRNEMRNLQRDGISPRLLALARKL